MSNLKKKNSQARQFQNNQEEIWTYSFILLGQYINHTHDTPGGTTNGGGGLKYKNIRGTGCAAQKG